MLIKNEVDIMKNQDTLVGLKPAKSKSSGRKKFLIVLGCIMLPIIVFMIAFVISFNRISGSKTAASPDSTPTPEESKKIQELQDEIAEKDEQIDSLKVQLEKYQKGDSDSTSSSVSSSKSSQQTTKTRTPSTVQKDIYNKVGN